MVTLLILRGSRRGLAVSGSWEIAIPHLICRVEKRIELMDSSSLRIKKEKKSGQQVLTTMVYAFFR